VRDDLLVERGYGDDCSEFREGDDDATSSILPGDVGLLWSSSTIYGLAGWAWTYGVDTVAEGSAGDEYDDRA